jgi:hypothetical protein
MQWPTLYWIVVPITKRYFTNLIVSSNSVFCEILITAISQYLWKHRLTPLRSSKLYSVLLKGIKSLLHSHHTTCTTDNIYLHTGAVTTEYTMDYTYHEANVQLATWKSLTGSVLTAFEGEEYSVTSRGHLIVLTMEL